MNTPPSNYIKIWHDYCADYYKYSMQAGSTEYNKAVKDCEDKKYNDWVKDHNPSTIIPKPPAQTVEEYEKEQKEKEQKGISKKLWVFAGVTVGVFVILSLIIGVKK